MILDQERLRKLYSDKGRTYPPDSLIFLEENRGEEMYIIIAGEVEILKTYKEKTLFDGKPIGFDSVSEVLNVLGPGDFFGEMALLNDAPRMATARARTNVEVIVMSRFDLENLMMPSPRIAIQMMRSIAERLRDACATPRLDTLLPQIKEAMRQLPGNQKGPGEPECVVSADAANHPAKAEELDEAVDP
ncbi:MAG: cyclic nucleotide-binding domain-containing protein [Candidatus Lindowbacteria bacterium]|nr:cyclic nucleotide-binding domain-containing protein [Candidatus Lindowbacteria bacterium]